MSAATAAAPRLRWQTATIERIEHPTPRMASVHLRTPLATHVAGQHVDVRLTADDGYQAQRSYSICSVPGAPLLELAIERLDDGEVSPYFHEVAQLGDGIELRGPIGGHFIWRAQDGGPLLLVAGGSGIAPFASMVREHAARASDAPVLLLYSARIGAELLYQDEFEEAQARRKDFLFIAATTREPPTRPGDFNRRLDTPAMREALARWGHMPRHAYVCGSNAFVENAASILVGEGIAAERIRTERYGGAA
jgi:ferredoxin-NADP reductase